MEAATPSKEFVCCAFGNIAYCVKACLLQGIYTLTNAIGILLATATLEDDTNLTGLQLEVLRLIGTAREQAIMTKHFGATESDETGLEASHGETCHSTVALVCLSAEMAINVGH